MNYLELNWPLLPCNGKVPAQDWKQWQTTRAPQAVVKQWLERGFNLALVTGELSGIDVVDDDRAKAKLSPLNITSPIVAQTPSGGRHYYFKHTPGLRNSVNAALRVDVRAEGGLVRLPPGGYSWIKPPTVEALAKLSPIPAELLARINPPRPAGQRVNIANYLGVTEGGRDNALLRATLSLLNKFQPQEWKTEVFPLVVAINNSYTPPLPLSDVERIFRQATSRVENYPKTNPQSLAPVFKNPPTTKSMVARRLEDRQLEKLAPQTGYASLDACYTPLVPGRLCVLAADTNLGKTAFAANLTHRVTSQKKHVLYFALEPGSALTDYLVSIDRRKPYAAITDEDRAAYCNDYLSPVTEGVDTLEQLVVYLQQSPRRYDLVIIDHLGYFMDSRANNFTAAQSQAMQILARLAQDRGCHILGIAHLNKTFSPHLDAWLPTANQISGSAAFKQDADDVLILARKPTVDEFGAVTYTGSDGVIFVAKSKSSKGPHLASLVFHPGSALITDPAEYYDSEINRIERGLL